MKRHNPKPIAEVGITKDIPTNELSKRLKGEKHSYIFIVFVFSKEFIFTDNVQIP